MKGRLVYTQNTVSEELQRELLLVATSTEVSGENDDGTKIRQFFLNRRCDAESM